MIKSELDAGRFEEVPLKDFSAPQVMTYLLYRQGYNVRKFLENRMDEEDD